MPEAPSRWHPILAASEPAAGHWVLIDSLGREYGRVTIVRRGDEVGYRAWFGEASVGSFTTLRRSCEAVHRAFLDAHGPGGFAPLPWHT
ncbi:hypothetical protein ARHIZOSPH14_24210 [Agromyces rhizosphaerae]|uniref:Uncharacterized protein n=1 Tax=Agromyces rhizosphaerae TaxID=88374 RepID=A0A9W6CZL5_9MICO|nr:hypothetical protein [Agromyces rhizosphaerae]GLI28179.1 hypothetical protein ARHIZOSPH14_24210 [Agromyces rhizosphaerae]